MNYEPQHWWWWASILLWLGGLYFLISVKREAISTDGATRLLVNTITSVMVPFFVLALFLPPWAKLSLIPIWIATAELSNRLLAHKMLSILRKEGARETAP